MPMLHSMFNPGREQRQQIKNTIRAVCGGRPRPEDAVLIASADFVGGGVAVQTHRRLYVQSSGRF